MILEKIQPGFSLGPYSTGTREKQVSMSRKEIHSKILKEKIAEFLLSQTFDFST